MRITKRNDYYLIKDDKDLVGAVKEIIATDERPILFVYITKDIESPNYIADIVDHIIKYFKRKGLDYVYFNKSGGNSRLLVSEMRARIYFLQNYLMYGII